MSYEQHFDNVTTEQSQLDEELFYETEQMITTDMKKVDEATYEIKNSIDGSNNPFLLKYMDSVDLFNFLADGDCAEPKRYVKETDDIFISGPVNYDFTEESEPVSNWVTILTEQEQFEEDAKKQQWIDENKERLEYQKQQKIKARKQKELIAKAKANKFNWNLPAELRGIVKPKPSIRPTKNVKPKQQKSKNRRKSKGGFKVRRITHKF